MRHHNERSLKILQIRFKPGNGVSIQMIGRFVEEQHIGIGDQQTAECHTATLTAGEWRDWRIRRRQTQGLHGQLNMMIKAPEVIMINRVLKFSEFRIQFIGLRIAQIIAQQFANFVISRHDGF